MRRTINGPANRNSITVTSSTTIGHVCITHSDSLLDPSSGAPKIDLICYWETVAPSLLPGLKDRPASLARAPGALSDGQFFQKHAEKLEIPFATSHLRLDPGHVRY